MTLHGEAGTGTGSSSELIVAASPPPKNSSKVNTSLHNHPCRPRERDTSTRLRAWQKLTTFSGHG